MSKASIVTDFAALDLSSASAESDDAICSKCGVSYTDRGACGCVVMGLTNGLTLNVPTSGKKNSRHFLL